MPLILCLTIVLIASAPLGSTSSDTQFTSYSIHNGMQIVLRSNHSSPMVACLLTVDAGTYVESPEISGTSHLLEHLLFDGTERFSRQEITERMRSIGGYLNAFTRKDYTTFILLVPSEHLEEGVEVLAEMLFHSIFPQDELVKERKVVVEEINKDEDSIQYRFEKFAAKIFYAGTPYARPILGEKNIINSIRREEIIDYYKARFFPSNMRALFVGDFREGEIKRMLDRHFGVERYTRSAVQKETPVIIRENRIHQTSMNAEKTYVGINIAAPPLGSNEYYAFEVLCTLINSPTSELNKRLKADPKIGLISAFISYDHHRGFSAATIELTAKSENVERIVDTALRALNAVSKHIPSDDTIDGVKVSLVTEEIYNEEKYHYYGLYKAQGMAIRGVEFLNEKVPGLKKVKRSDVKRVAKQYLKNPDYSAAALIPESEFASIEKHPIAPLYRDWTMANGMRFIVKHNEDSRVFAAHFLFENRLACEPSGKQGIVEVLSRALLTGTMTMDEEALERALRSIGAKVEYTDNPYIPYDDYRTRGDYSFLRFETVDDYYEKGLALLNEIVFNPALQGEHLEQIKEELKSLIAQRDMTPSKLGRQLFLQRLFQGHPSGQDVLGSVESIESVTIEDLKDFHSRYFSPENIIVTIATSVDPDRVQSKIEEIFGNLPGGRADGCSYPVPKPVRGIVEVTAPVESAQNYIYVGNLIPDVTKDDVIPLTVANGVLSSRLGEELREKRGLAYSVGSSIYFGKDYAYIVISMGTGGQHLEEAKRGLLEIVGQLRDEITEDDVASFRSSYSGRALMRRLARINQTYYMGLNEFRGFGYRFDETFLENLKTVTVDEVNRAARRCISAEDGVIAIAGPAE